MDREGEPQHVETLDPEEAYGLFGHEIRFEILVALWEAPDYSLSFTELRDEVGVRDTGQFNYHLSKLVGRFVAHVDDEYELLHPGHRVIDAIQTGIFHESVDLDPIDTGDDCRHCGCSLFFEYENYVGAVRCGACGEKAVEYPYEPAGFAGRSDERVVRDFDRHVRSVWLLAFDGVCPSCSGPVGRGLVAEAEVSLSALDRYDDFFADDHPVVASLDCRRCSFYSYLPATVAALGHPGVLGFLHDRGVDVRETRTWELDFVLDPSRLTVTSTDPYRLAVPVAADGDELVATVDESLAVAIRD